MDLPELLASADAVSAARPATPSIPPAISDRDLGPRIVHALLPIPGKGGSDWAYAWVPIIGPATGGVVAGLAARAFT
ncbi:MAG: major intrinsic protein [Actinoallomurus sp.]|nr:major intrinsic protein [Actinoallomurus sp.]